MKKITAVLPARNCRQDLYRCLSVLGRGKTVPDIIVVDDGSDDETEKMIRRHWPAVTYLSLPAHTGYAHASNAGLRLVRTEYAFLIRPDFVAGKNCLSRLLETMEGDESVFCAVPEFRAAQAGKKTGKVDRESCADRIFRKAEVKTFFPGTDWKSRRRHAVKQIIAVPDGCAMYRMSALEEIGWMDERHFDSLEAFDLSLRAALHGWKTAEVRGAAVGCRARDGGGAKSALRQQLAVGNGRYVFYKNIPAIMRLPGLPVFAAVDAAQLASFVRRGGLGSYKTALERGHALCSLEKDRRAALGGGVGIWPENLSDASFLGMDEAAEKMYPLFLSEKEPVLAGRLARYLRIQWMLTAELPQLIRLLV